MIYAPALEQMGAAPRDGTHILALQQHETEDCRPTWREWREIWWDQTGRRIWRDGPLLNWVSGDEDDRGWHGEALFVGWIPCPKKP